MRGANLCTALLGLLLMMPSLAHSQTYATLPTIGDISCGTSSGSTIAATDSASFATALTNANGGDTITLTAGATFTGPFTLPVKSGSSCITIRSSTADGNLPASGVRISPAYASVLPKIVSSGGNDNAINFSYGAHHYKFIGVEFTTSSEGAVVDTLINIGDDGMTTLSQLPHHLEFDRVYVHAFSSTSILKRGMALHGASVTVKNSYFSEFKIVGQDAQAIAGWNGSGPYRITNNYLSASTENILFGGSTAFIPNVIASDIEVKYNYFFKKLTWRIDDPSYAGTAWTEKNIFELKCAQRVLIEGNTLENAWPHAQPGYAFTFTPRDDAGFTPWTQVQDITVKNNRIINVGGFSQILAEDNNNPTGLTNNITYLNNLATGIGWTGDSGSGRVVLTNAATFKSSGTAANTVAEHNTLIGSIASGTVLLADDSGLGKPTSTGLYWRNNIHYHNDFGIFGSGASVGTTGLNAYWGVSWVYLGNVMITNPYPQLYPAGNFNAADLSSVGFTNTGTGDYSLTGVSAYHNAGTDGTDIGVDMVALNAALAGTTQMSSQGTSRGQATPRTQASGRTQAAPRIQE